MHRDRTQRYQGGLGQECGDIIVAATPVEEFPTNFAATTNIIDSIYEFGTHNCPLCASLTRGAGVTAEQAPYTTSVIQCI